MHFLRPLHAACAEIEGPDILTFYIKQGRQLVGTKSGLPLDQTTASAAASASMPALRCARLQA
jgi:hypothetical protein